MKTTFFCLFSFLVLSASAQNNRHIGTWKGVEKEQTINMTFGADGFVTLEMQGTVLGGKEFELNGRKMSTPYEIDYAPESPAFVIMMKNLETDKIESKMVGTITFKENNTASICMKRFYKGEAPAEFSADDCLLFTKIN